MEDGDALRREIRARRAASVAFAAAATALASGCLLASASEPASARSSGVIVVALARLGCGSVSVPVLSKTIGVDVGEPLERVAGIEHHAVAEHRARRDHLHRRHGEAERAGTGDDQHGDGDHQRRLPRQAEQQPADEGRQRGQVHDRRVEARRRDRRAARRTSAARSRARADELTSSSSVPSAALLTRTRSAPARLSVPA